jgi:hypothetical protein
MCLCSPTHISERYCGGKAGGSKDCRHPLTDSPLKPLTVQASGAQLEFHARLDDAPRASPHEHPGVVAGHIGFDHSKIEELVKRLKVQAGTAINNRDGVAARHYLELAHLAEDAGKLLRAVVEGIHRAPGSVGSHVPNPEVIGKGEPA